MEMSNTRLEKLLEFQRQQPDDLFLKYAMAMEYLGMKNIERAFLLFNEVIEKDIHYVAAYYQLGKILESRGEEADAIKMFEKGLAEAQLKKDMKTVNEFRTAIDELCF
jgi:tetratricopeptide (TPR) repeat protein